MIKITPTKQELLELRKKVNKHYTFHNDFDVMQSINNSSRNSQKNVFTPLTINTDVSRIVNNLQQTIVLSQPKPRFDELRKELKKSAIRVQRIKNGASLSTVFSDSSSSYQIQEPKSVAFIDEDKAIHEPKEYIVPGVVVSPDFVMPRSAVEQSFISPSQNEFNRLKNEIFEEDRLHYNQTIQEINLYTRRLPYAIPQTFKDYQKYGLREAQRRAKRAAVLSALKIKRTEAWWSEFVADISASGKSFPNDILVEFASLSQYNSDSFSRFYIKTVRKYKKPKTIRYLLQKANFHGKFMEDYFLAMILEKADMKLSTPKPPLNSQAQKSPRYIH